MVELDIIEYWPAFCELDREPRINRVKDLYQVGTVDWLVKRCEGTIMYVSGNHILSLRPSGEHWVVARIRIVGGADDE